MGLGSWDVEPGVQISLLGESPFPCDDVVRSLELIGLLASVMCMGLWMRVMGASEESEGTGDEKKSAVVEVNLV
jgi:hypothetical protein